MRVRLNAVLLFLIVFGLSASAQPRDLDLVASDGAKLRATYYSPGKPGPAMLLLHQCNMDRKAWVSLANALMQRGVHVLTFDYRGYGESRAVPTEYPKLPSDVDAGLALLLAQPGVNKARVAAGGASCGVTNSVLLARRNDQVKALVLLSGATSDAGRAYLENSGIAVFFAFSADEGGPLPGMKDTVGKSKNQASTVRELNHAGHGVPMFESDKTLLPAIADWVAKVLQ